VAVAGIWLAEGQVACCKDGLGKRCKCNHSSWWCELDPEAFGPGKIAVDSIWHKNYVGQNPMAIGGPWKLQGQMGAVRLPTSRDCIRGGLCCPCLLIQC
jgi:hypothetical protein